MPAGKIKEESDDEFEDQGADNFDGMGLRSELLRGVYAYGLERPSAVQQRTITPIIQGRNVIAQAPPGTGKTATFVIPVLQRLDTSSKFNQALILTNTSELAAEIQKEVQSIGSYMNVGCYACVNSTNIREDIPRLREGVQVVVGTPARVWDMIQRHTLKMTDIRMFCLYDANELLSPSFRDQVMKIFQLLGKNTQIVFLSATEPTNALKVAEASIPDALQILAKGNTLTLEGIKQFYIPIKKAGKLVTLCKLHETTTKAVVFCNSKRAAGQLTAALNERKLAVSVIHGKVEREQCAVLMNEFLSGPSRILITTDRYARIVDEQQVSVVINYDPPYPKKYIQRVGHSGRLGNNRIAINLVTDGEIDKLREIERFYKIEVEEMPQNFPDVFWATQHQGLPSVKVEEPHGTTTASPTLRSADISPLPSAVHVPEARGSDIANRDECTEGFMTQSLQAQLLGTAQTKNYSLRTRVDLLTDRLEEETQRADQAERLANEAGSQLEALRLESGHRNKRYCSPRHYD